MGAHGNSDRSTPSTGMQALAYPMPGRKVAAWSAGSIAIVQAVNNCMVFLLSGLTLRTTESRDTLRRWQGHPPHHVVPCVSHRAHLLQAV